MPRYGSAKLAIFSNAGAATSPPAWTTFGSSTITAARNLGSSAGANPTNDATNLSFEYSPFSAFSAVPVLPAMS